MIFPSRVPEGSCATFRIAANAAAACSHRCKPVDGRIRHLAVNTAAEDGKFIGESVAVFTARYLIRLSTGLHLWLHEVLGRFLI